MSPSALIDDGLNTKDVAKSVMNHQTPQTNGAGKDSTSLAVGVQLNGSQPITNCVSPEYEAKMPHLNISEDYSVAEQPIGTIRPVRMICVGAGASGVNLAYQVQKNMQKTDLVIYEKNPSEGGTWYENRYPGCKCDIRESLSLSRSECTDLVN